jgi:glycosyltransferase involved in cell wall biosynthesis
MIRFSVIIPLYNKVEYINETLQSILDQTKLPYELIIVDDCSTDGSLEKAIAFLEKTPSRFNAVHIEIIKLEENHGPGYARNIGAKKATGDIVSFLDADDLYKPELLEKIELFTTHIDVGFIVIGIQLFPSNETYPEMDEIEPFIMPVMENAYQLEKPLDVIISPGFIMGTGSNVFVKRKWIEQIHYHEGVRMNEGNDFWYRVMRNAMKENEACFGLLTGNYIQVREVIGSLSRRKYTNWRDIDVPLVFIRYQKSNDTYDRLLTGLICSRWLPNAIENLPSFKQKALFIFYHRKVFWHQLHYQIYKRQFL